MSSEVIDMTYSSDEEEQRLPINFEAAAAAFADPAALGKRTTAAVAATLVAGTGTLVGMQAGGPGGGVIGGGIIGDGGVIPGSGNRGRSGGSGSGAKFDDGLELIGSDSDDEQVEMAAQAHGPDAFFNYTQAPVALDGRGGVQPPQPSPHDAAASQAPAATTGHQWGTGDTHGGDAGGVGARLCSKDGSGGSSRGGRGSRSGSVADLFGGGEHSGPSKGGSNISASAAMSAALQERLEKDNHARQEAVTLLEKEDHRRRLGLKWWIRGKPVTQDDDGGGDGGGGGGGGQGATADGVGSGATATASAAAQTVAAAPPGAAYRTAADLAAITASINRANPGIDASAVLAALVTGAGIATEDAIPPPMLAFLAPWEVHTRGVGSRLLAKMGFKGECGLKATLFATTPGQPRPRFAPRPSTVAVAASEPLASGPGLGYQDGGYGPCPSAPCEIVREKACSSRNYCGVEVLFPYAKPMKPQDELMMRLVTALTRKKHALLESPTGTGKSAALLCASLAWQRAECVARGTAPRIFYGARTHSQLRQMVKELRNTPYRPVMAVLGSRKHLCVHPDVVGGDWDPYDRTCKSAANDDGDDEDDDFGANGGGGAASRGDLQQSCYDMRRRVEGDRRSMNYNDDRPDFHRDLDHIHATNARRRAEAAR
ncbi:unnamed protein product, partial [Phaeothamnion confervicola]